MAKMPNAPLGVGRRLADGCRHPAVNMVEELGNNQIIDARAGHVGGGSVEEIWFTQSSHFLA